MPKGFWEFTPSGKQPIRLACRYLRHAVTRIPINAQTPSTTCYLPNTIVLAAQDHSNTRDIFFVRLNGFFQDGLWLPKRVDDRATIVDAESLGPRGAMKRRIGRAAKRELRQWCRITANHWQEWGAAHMPVEFYRSRWQSFLDYFRGPFNVSAVVYDSETEIEWFGASPGAYQYLNECHVHPQVPNAISRRSLGASQEVIAFAKICPRVQAHAGLRKWTQRVWYVTHKDKTHLDGIDPRDDYSDCVNPLKVCPGVPSVAFDGHLTPIDDYRRAVACAESKQFLENANVTH